MKVTLNDVATAFISGNSPNPNEEIELPETGDLMTFSGLNLSAMSRAGILEFDDPVAATLFEFLEKSTKFK